jgi:hypothetical protein
LARLSSSTRDQRLADREVRDLVFDLELGNSPAACRRRSCTAFLIVSA